MCRSARPATSASPRDKHAQILRMNADGSGEEMVARGMRNTVGFDWHPKTEELWFTDNQRDWLSEDLPQRRAQRCQGPRPDALRLSRTATRATWPIPSSAGASRATTTSSRPHCSARTRRRSACASTPAGCSRRSTRAPSSWPGTGRGTAPRSTRRRGGRLSTTARVAQVEPFLTGLVKDNQYLGRPVDVMVMKDGSLLVSDDHNGAIYRISYGVKGRAPAELDELARRRPLTSTRQWTCCCPCSPGRRAG